jgi:hypothetical protein
VRDDEHHREEEDDRREIDRRQRLRRADDPEGDHQDGADDRRSRAIDLHPWKLAEREDEIAAEENQGSGKDACV